MRDFSVTEEFDKLWVGQDFLLAAVIILAVSVFFLFRKCSDIDSKIEKRTLCVEEVDEAKMFRVVRGKKG